MSTVLLLLVPLVVIGVLVWSYRRKVAAREAASAERMRALLGNSRVDTKTPPAGSAPVTATAKPSAATAKPFADMPRLPAANPATVVPLKPASVTGFSVRAQYVRAEYVPVYRLLQSVLPQHEVFPQVMLAAFIQPSPGLTGFALEAQERRLAGIEVDFLVCDSALKPVAAVHCGTPEAVPFAAACVAAAGMRWVAIVPDTLPAPGDLRARVLGG